MAKNKKSRAKHQSTPVEKPSQFPPLMLGNFRVPAFDGASMVFGAQINEYPPMGSIPTVDRKFEDVADALFFRGGTLTEHGLKMKAGIDHAAAMAAIRSWPCSFAPKHEHKTATIAWAFSEWCEAAP